MAERAAKDFLTVTELADTLVRTEGISFREAHDAVAEAVRVCGGNDDPRSIAAALKSVRPSLGLSVDEIEKVLDPAHFVHIRRITGGPAPERTSEALARARERQKAIETWLAEKAERLDAVRRR
jgi:argininosuccinate lyase